MRLTFLDCKYLITFAIELDPAPTLRSPYCSMFRLYSCEACSLDSTTALSPLRGGAGQGGGGLGGWER